LFRRGGAIGRHRLVEIVNHGGMAPCVFVDATVDDRRRVRARNGE
jgi:predicted homoserine dehydrogenase-like protein